MAAEDLTSQNEQLSSLDIASFKKDLSTPVDSQHLRELDAHFIGEIQREDEEKDRLPMSEQLAMNEFPRHTPFDKLTGNIELMDVKDEARVRTERHVILSLLNHPVRELARKRFEAKPFEPIKEKHIPVMDRATEQGIAVTFNDFGLVPSEPNPNTNADESANSIFAQGLFMRTTKELVTTPYWLAPMPDIASARSLETMAVAGGIGFIPIDNIWGDVKNQLIMHRRVQELLDRETVFPAVQNGDNIRERVRELVGVTLKANPRDALIRAQLFFDQIDPSLRLLVRIYDPRSFMRMEETVKALKDKYGEKIIIVAGQVTGAEQAKRLEEAGASAEIVGIGEGGICSTPHEGSLVTVNAQTGYKLAQANLGIPYLFEGGVGSRTSIAVALGASGVSKSQAIAGGTIEQPPGRYWHTERGKMEKNYNGEASPSTKYGGGKTDALGFPLFVEGISSSVAYDKNAPSIAHKNYFVMQSLATSIIFARASSLDELRLTKEPKLWTQSANSAFSSSPHHNGN